MEINGLVKRIHANNGTKYRNNDQNTAAIQKQEYQGTLLTTTVLQQRKPEDQYKHEVWRQ